jgi:predicted methyltransferase
MKSVPYLAALPFSAFLIFLSAHADTQTPDSLARALADPRRPAEQVSLDATRKPAQQLTHCPPREVAGTRLLEHDPAYANVSVLSDAAANFRVPEKLDVIWTAQNYHDLHDTFMGPADVTALNRRFFDALRPGGVYLVIDHVAETGSGLRDTESLHRIDPRRLRREIETAGFVFDAESNALRNGSDDHKSSVFDPSVRGRTDQVVYRFRKPR